MMGGKGGGGGSVKPGIATATTYDPAEALQQFQQAAQALIGPVGQSSLSTAMANAQAQSQSIPYSSASANAVQQFQQMLGITPADTKTGTINQQIDALQSQFDAAGSNKVNKQVSGILSNLRTVSTQLENSNDPAQRAKLQTQAQGLLNQALAVKPVTTTTTAKAAPVTPTKPIEPYRLMSNDRYGNYALNLPGGPNARLKKIYDDIVAGKTPDYSTLPARYAERAKEWYAKQPVPSAKVEAPKTISTTDTLDSQLKTSLERLRDSYKTIDINRPQGFTGEEVMEQIQATPGYQAQFEQGMQALTRQQAAAGNVASGAAMLQAQQFGQGLAGTVYQNQLANLGQLAGITMPVTQQQIAQTSSGNQFATQLGLMPAQASQQAYNLGGQGLLQAGLSNAQSKTQASIANAQAQTQASAANAQLQQQQQGQMLGLLGGIAGGPIGSAVGGGLSSLFKL